MFKNKDKNIKDISGPTAYDTARLFYRTEKVVTALYMVTDCMSDNEPIRHKLRTLSVSLVSTVRSTLLKNQFETHFITTEVIHSIDEIFSFLTMATTLGFISVMNYEILYKEFNTIRQYFMDQQTAVSFGHENEFGSDKRATSFVLSPDFFDHEENISDSISAQRNMSVIKDTNRQNIFPKSQTNLIPKTAIDSKRQTTNSKPEHLEERNAKIVEIIKTKGQSVSITDITNIIKDCSEKTIQRSLTQLSDTGIIKRTGEKRWARYALA